MASARRFKRSPNDSLQAMLVNFNQTPASMLARPAALS
jgi:hypothetical protein